MSSSIVKYNSDYNIDIVMCIDATASMSPFLSAVKNNALTTYRDLSVAFEKRNKRIGTLRVRLIVFRDYEADGDDAMYATRFFTLPEETEQFEREVKNIVPKGGGDDPEDGLEALAYAIQSDWTKKDGRKRHVIVVWSDAGTHPLGSGKVYAGYPGNEMPSDFGELTQWWGDRLEPGKMNCDAKRLLIFAPEELHWSNISDAWDNVIQFPSEGGNGLMEVEYSEIIGAIGNAC